MEVTRDVVMDLLPLYQAGEASGDTRRLVEAFLARDSALARIAASSAREVLRAEPAAAPREQDADLRALRTTKRLVRLREAAFFMAIFLTVSPLTAYDTSWGSGWVIRDRPWLALGLGAAAAAMWAVHIALRRRLATSGL